METLEVVKKWSKDTGKTETHATIGGVLDGSLLDVAGVEAVGKLPSKQELIQRIAVAINEAGAGRIVRLINQVPTKVARSIKLATEEDGEGTVAALAVGGEEVDAAAQDDAESAEGEATTSELAALLEEANEIGASLDDVLASLRRDLCPPNPDAPAPEDLPSYKLKQKLLATREKYRLHPTDC